MEVQLTGCPKGIDVIALNTMIQSVVQHNEGVEPKRKLRCHLLMKNKWEIAEALFMFDGAGHPQLLADLIKDSIDDGRLLVKSWRKEGVFNHPALCPSAVVAWAIHNKLNLPEEVKRWYLTQQPVTKSVVNGSATSPSDTKPRTTNLKRAIIAAVNSFSKKPSIGELWRYFQDDKDGSGFILDYTDDALTWTDTKGNIHDTTKKSVQNTLARLNHPA